MEKENKMPMANPRTENRMTLAYARPKFDDQAHRFLRNCSNELDLLPPEIILVEGDGNDRPSLYVDDNDCFYVGYARGDDLPEGKEALEGYGIRIG